MTEKEYSRIHLFVKSKKYAQKRKFIKYLFCELFAFIMSYVCYHNPVFREKEIMIFEITGDIDIRGIR